MAEQTRETGAARGRLGKAVARALAIKLGAQSDGTPGNLFSLNGKLVNIKSTSTDRALINVYNTVSLRTDTLVVAILVGGATYDVFSLDQEEFVRLSAPARSVMSGKARSISARRCREAGTPLGRYQLDLQDL